MIRTLEIVPRWRFPDYFDAGGWEFDKLGDHLEYLQPTPYLVRSTKYDNNYPVPVLTAGKTFLLGYTDEVDGIFDQDLPVIIFDDFTTSSKFVNFPFKVKSSAMKILLPKNNSNIRFFYELLQVIDYEVAGHGRHWISFFANMKVPVPGAGEQKKVADCLSSVDDRIGAETRKLDVLKAHKQSLMQQLFPAEGQRLPRLRFPAFRSDVIWVSSKVGDIAEIRSGGTPRRTNLDNWGGDIPWVTTSLIDSNIIRDANECITQMGLKDSAAKVFPKGTVLMAMYGQGKTRGKVAILGIDAATNQACAAISVGDRVNANFLFHNLDYRYAEIRSISNPGGQENLSGELIKNINFTYPKEREEQQKISDCLSSLESLIAAQVCKITLLQQHKRGLMQGLFPALETTVS
ncbi:restriction endonuclease subunit S [Xanthomonas sp. BRIP62418]|uniref:restriction endonuclease subunit S n=1 Tax=Xanthomonas sp. BRIP62418 TaxID=2182391 RepID=UPI0013DF73D1|nr:restriction endonuclease subunit S [Xanthomonas sp. BRIP62418]